MIVIVQMLLRGPHLERDIAGLHPLIRASSSWSTIPVTKARMRAQSIPPPRQPIRNCLPKKS
jgi:hypothetical protein